MKNIHVLPTDKPSRLYYNKNGRITFSLCKTEKENTPLKPCYNIYITSDEYIGLSYYLDGNLVRKGVVDDKDYWKVRKDYKKIILTTDYQLIKDGVQAIDNEFIEWFVKNQSCEEVEIKLVEQRSHLSLNDWVDADENGKFPISIAGAFCYRKTYKIIIPRTTEQIINEDYAGGLEMGQIIPKEEPKQETLEEAARNYKDLKLPDDLYDGFIAGAKWQQKRMYSQEDLKEAYNSATENEYRFINQYHFGARIKFEKWFEQFKK